MAKRGGILPKKIKGFWEQVAFSIPITTLLSWDSFAKGAGMGLGPCLAAKIFCAPCAQRPHLSPLALYRGRSNQVVCQGSV